MYYCKTWPHEPAYLILTNAAAGFSLAFSCSDGFSPQLLWPYMAISFPFIWKLWTYYLYKIDGFIEKNCSFKLIFEYHNDDKGYFSDLKYQQCLFFPLLVFCILFAVISGQYHWACTGIIGVFFLPVPVGIMIHIFKFILRLPLDQVSWLKKALVPGVQESPKCECAYEVLQCPCLKVFTYLYIVV